MTSLWWRSWHGAPTDPKWIAVAKRSVTQPGIVSAVAWALFDHASQQVDRGDVSRFDAETYAAFSGFDQGTIEAIIGAMREKELIVNNRLCAWETRQPQREDNSSERVRKHRNAVKRNVTQGNAILDKIREDKKGSVPPINLEFEKFKRAYPKRKGSQGWPMALKFFEKAECPASDLIAAASRFAETIPKDSQGSSFVPMAETWMRKQSWKEFMPTEEDKKRAEETERFLESRGYGKKPDSS